MTASRYTQYASLQDRVVFISGGSSGIGAELVRAFAAQGARVAFCGTKPEGGKSLIDEVVAAGPAAADARLPIHRPWYAPCDVRDVAAYQALLARVAAELGPVRVLVNNGADIAFKFKDWTALMYARAKKHTEIVKFLEVYIFLFVPE